LTATVDFLTVTNSIAALTIAGVTILDTDQIPDAVGLDFAVLAPMPEAFITNVEVTRDELSAQKLVLRYTLTYRYYHCKIQGGLGGLFATYAGLITNAAAILLAFSSDATLAGAVDNDMPQVLNIGPVSDPSGNAYHGCDITLRIMQFLEV
jgi:hypothetical protein